MTTKWLLLRGLGREQRHWGGFKSSLEQQYGTESIVCVDLPGFGNRNHIGSPTSVRSIAKDIRHQLPKNMKFNIFGISLGGMVSVELTQLILPQVNTLTLANTSFGNFSWFYHRLQLKSVQHFVKAGYVKSTIDKEKSILSIVSNKNLHDLPVAEWAKFYEERPYQLKNFARQLLAAATYSAPQTPPEVPILLLSSLADRMVSHECTQNIADKWGCDVEFHNTAGHEICLDAPEWVIKQCTHFINKHSK